MLPKRNRLTKREIGQIKGSKAKIIQGMYFGLAFFPKADERKFGLIISSKVSKKAVERNRIKRLLFQTIATGALDRPGWFLFLAKRRSLTASKEDLEKELELLKNRLLA